MKRMIPQALIAWVKSLFHRIAPGEGEADIEIGGNLGVDGQLIVNTEPYFEPKNTPLPILFANGYAKVGFDNDNYGGDFGFYATMGAHKNSILMGSISLTGDTAVGLSYFPDDWGNRYNLIYVRNDDEATIYIGDTEQNQNIIINKQTTAKDNFIFQSNVQLGSTILTEDQLKKLLALIPAE